MSMRILKVAVGGGINEENLKGTLLYKLFEKLSKSSIKFSNFSSADLIFYGPYYNFYEKIANKLKKRIYPSQYFEPRILNFSKNKKKNSKEIFLSFENSIKFKDIKADFYFTSLLGVTDHNHFRIPYWKNCANWPEYDIYFNDNSDNVIHRYGEAYDTNRLTQEFGNSFLTKNRKFCIFTSHMMYPRKQIYEVFKNNFTVDGYGPYFDKKNVSHNSGIIKKKDILKNYMFNLCPHTFSTPGLYSSDVSDAFLSGSLPITWADKNIDNDFNKKAFINLIDYQYENFSEIINYLKDDNFLKKFVKEPLILKKPDLEKEIEFVQRIINSL